MSREAIESFVDEIRDDLPKLRHAIAVMHACPDDQLAQEEAHRLTHSIKGTALLVGVTGLSQIALHQELLLEHLIGGQVAFDDMLRDSLERLTDLIESFAEGLLVGTVPEQRLLDDAQWLFNRHTMDASRADAQAQTDHEMPGAGVVTADANSESSGSSQSVNGEVAEDTPPPNLESTPDVSNDKPSNPDETTSAHVREAASVTKTTRIAAPTENVNWASDTPSGSAEFPSESLSYEVGDLEPQTETSEATLERFRHVAPEHLNVLGVMLDGYRRDLTRWDALAEVRRRLHALKEFADSVGFSEFARLALHAEDLLQRLLDRTVPPTDGAADCLQACIDALEEHLHGRLDDSILPLLHERLDQISGTRPEPACPTLDSPQAQTADADANSNLPPAESALCNQDAAQVVTVNAAGVLTTAEFDERSQSRSASLPTTVANGAAVDVEFDDRSQLSAEMLEVFTEEAEDHLRQIYGAFTGLEAAPTQLSLIQDVRRSAHTIKGAAGSVGLKLISKLSHRMEDLLDRLFESQQPVESPTLALLYSTADTLHELVHGDFPPDDMRATITQLYRQYDVILAPAEPTAALPETVAVNLTSTHELPSATDVVIPSAAPMEETKCDAGTDTDIEFLPQDVAPHERPSDATSNSTSDDDLAEATTAAPLTAQTLVTGLGPETIAAEAVPEPPSSPRSNELVVTDALPMLAAWSRLAEPMAETPADEPKRGTTKSQGDSLRVAAERIDSLMRQVSELIINRTAFEQRMSDFARCVEKIQRSVERLRHTSHELDAKYSVGALNGRNRLRGDGASLLPHRRFSDLANDEFDALEFDRYTEFHVLSRSLAETSSDIKAVSGELRTLLGDFDQLLNRQGRLSRETQDRLMRIRMVPLATLATRLHRTVRVTAGQRGKGVDFLLQGGDTELDKVVLEELVDPLMHVLRNSVDHGIEPSSVRLARGKPERGTIRVQAFYQGTQVVVRVSDDGAGLDFDAIRQTAIRNGLAATSDIANMDEQQLAEFIFVPGFSTAHELSEVSGRGMGMDIVRVRVQKLKGTIHVESKPGEGATFTIRLPMTLAVTRALLVQTAGEMFALPIQAVVQILRLERQDVEQLGDSPVVRLGDEPLPLVHMAERLKLRRPADRLSETLPVLVVASGDRKIAVAVDRILSARDIVVKTLGTHLRRVKGLIGATLLGDGSVVPILDTADLVDSVTAFTAPPAARLVPPPHHVTSRDEKPTIMIVDDSVSVRRVMLNLLKSAGWDVLDAKDGIDALEKLREAEQAPALFLLDIEMPRMDGYELLSTLRSQPAYRETPIVMITSRAGNKHRDKALSLGATDYVIKPYQDDQLLALIRELLAHSDPLSAVRHELSVAHAGQ